MDANANVFINRIKIVFYSWLISGTSLMNRIRSNSKQWIKYPILPRASEGEVLLSHTQGAAEISLADQRKDFGQAILTFITWMVLGFAAGYLIGIIIPG